MDTITKFRVLSTIIIDLVIVMQTIIGGIALYHFW
jgi:hypothetical protein